MEYAWTYIPNDNANYENLIGSLTPWPVPENVSTAEELKAALEAEGNKIVKLTADVLYDIREYIDIKGNKTLELNGHKIEFLLWGTVIPAGAQLKIDGMVDGSEIKSGVAMIFEMRGGLLTIDGGYINSLFHVMFIPPSAAGGRIEINNGYFQAIRGRVIYSASKQDLDPPEIVINGGTFISNTYNA